MYSPPSKVTGIAESAIAGSSAYRPTTASTTKPTPCGIVFAERLLRLLGHVRDRLDPGVGDHADRDPEGEVPPGRRRAEVDLADQQVRVEHEDDPDDDEQDLGEQVGDREHEVEPSRLLGALDVEQREQPDQDDAADHVPGPVAERIPEDGQVVRARRTPRSRS